MATKTTKGKKPSVPAAVRGSNKDGLDLLHQLNDDLGTPAPKPKPEKSNKLEVNLDGEEAGCLASWVATSQVSKYVEERLKGDKESLSEWALDWFVSRLWSDKSVPSNPTMKTKKNGRTDSQAIYQFQNRFKLHKPDGDQRQGIIDTLVDQGLSEEAATNLVDNELDVQPFTTTRPLNELLAGRYEQRQWVEATEEEQALGKKLLMVLKENLTGNELKAVLLRDAKVTVRNGFLDRVAGYVEDEEQLKAVFRVITPTHFPSHGKFAVADNATEQTERLISHAADVIDSAGNK